jgi:hypothetical protein
VLAASGVFVVFSAWPWVVAALGVVFVVLGGLLLA